MWGGKPWWWLWISICPIKFCKLDKHAFFLFLATISVFMIVYICICIRIWISFRYLKYLPAQDLQVGQTFSYFVLGHSFAIHHRNKPIVIWRCPNITHCLDNQKLIEYEYQISNIEYWIFIIETSPLSSEMSSQQIWIDYFTLFILFKLLYTA